MQDLIDVLQGEDQELWKAPRLLRADVLEAAGTLSPMEARYMVDSYYTLQHYRIQSHNQTYALETSAEPNRLTEWMEGRYRQLEAQIQRVLDAYSQREIGVWARSNVGIGPVIAAGLMAHLDGELPETVGHWWSFAGLNPEVTWGKGEKRP